MSHVVHVKCQISDLDAFEKACEKLGGQLHRNARQFAYYAGATSPCLHKVSVKGARAGAYEVGLVQAKAEDPGTFGMACDFYDGTLTQRFGSNLEGLQNEYLATVAEDKMAEAGWLTRREVDAQARIHVYGEKF